MKQSKRNKYDYLLIVIVSLLVFGGFGGSLQPIRVISILLSPFTIWFYTLNTEKRFRKLLLGVFILYSYIAFSILWSSDIDEGVKEVMYYTSHFCLFLLIIALYNKSINPFKSILIGWTSFILLTQFVAFNEIFFDKHLSLSTFDSDRMINVGGLIVQKKFAAVTFGNYNGYVTVVAMSLPFLFGGFMFVHNKLQQLISLLIIVFAYFTLFINASRGGLLAGAVTAFIFFFFSKKKKIKKTKFIKLILLPVIIYMTIKYSNVIFEQLFFRQYAGSSFTQDAGRMSLFRKAFQAFLEKPFFGGGIGSIQKEMEGAYILLPHNMFLEILVQFGFLTGLFFIMYMLSHLVYVKGSNNNIIKFIIYSSVFSLPIVSIINSGYLLSPTTWAYLATMYCIAFIESRSYKANFICLNE